MRRPAPPSPPPSRLRLQTALVFAACATLYFLTRSPALDEWDSVQFALGVGDFNLWRHQPHPPGYPLYIAAAWLVAHGLHLGVPTALELVSALGGGLFVAGWFALAARHFGRTVAWITAASLATLLITWMSATKALSDPLATGLLALLLLLADRCRRVTTENSFPLLGAMAFAGAAAAAARPQNFGVVLLIVCLATAACRPTAAPPRGRRWTVSLGVLLGGCLLWLVPTAWTQARVPDSNGDWLAYVHQLSFQWHWRLNQPKAFVGASSGGDPGENLWLYRVQHHPLGWLTRGFGFALDSPWGWLGVAVLAVGWGLFLRARRRQGKETRSPFWREQAPWAAVYTLMIFCFLPGDQRYYLPIFPLLILPAVLGWRSLDGRLAWLTLLVPAATLAAVLPFVGPNHTEAAPPVRMLRWLDARYPPAARPAVWLYLRDARRHAEWYAPAFHLVSLTAWATTPEPAVPGPPLAVYTDDPEYAAAQPAGWRQVETFRRSPLIYRKHNTCVLYQWVGAGTPDGRDSR